MKQTVKLNLGRKASCREHSGNAKRLVQKLCDFGNHFLRRWQRRENLCDQCPTKLHSFFHGFVSGQSEMLEYAAFRRVAGLRGMPANLTNGEDP
jgi:hypothetical protein